MRLSLRIAIPLAALAAVTLAAPAASARTTLACPLANPAWVSPGQFGSTTIPPYTYQNNMYSPQGDGAAVTCAGQPGATPQWGFQAVAPNSPGHVQGYPNQGRSFGTAYSSFTTLKYGFTQAFKGASGTTVESAIDLFLNGNYSSLTSTEIMVWTHQFGTYPPAGHDTGVQVTDKGGTYELWYRAADSAHHTIITFLRTAAQNSGTVYEKSLITWLIGHPAYNAGIGSNPTVTSSQYGVELFGTNDVPVTFTSTGSYTAS